MERPRPVLTPLNEPFFRGAAAGRLLLQRCERCGAIHYYPRAVCPDCLGRELAWVPASGRGEVLSFSWVHKPQHPSFMAEAPIPFVAVRLDEGPVMFSRLSCGPDEEIAIGARVVVDGAASDGGGPVFALES